MKSFECKNELFADVDLGSKDNVLMCIEGGREEARELFDILKQLFASAGFEEASPTPDHLVIYFVVHKDQIPEFHNAVESFKWGDNESDNQ